MQVNIKTTFAVSCLFTVNMWSEKGEGKGLLVHVIKTYGWVEA